MNGRGFFCSDSFCHWGISQSKNESCMVREEPRYFLLGFFYSFARMYGILEDARFVMSAKIMADLLRFPLLRIGRTNHFSEELYRIRIILAFEDEQDTRSRNEVINHWLEERLARVMCVVFAQHLHIKRPCFFMDNLEAGSLELIENHSMCVEITIRLQYC
ncbi:MAG: hypothetical protein ACD_78C00345G0005, partial [uncultured bacterium (gcode 4)]